MVTQVHVVHSFFLNFHHTHPLKQSILTLIIVCVFSPKHSIQWGSRTTILGGCNSTCNESKSILLVTSCYLKIIQIFGGNLTVFLYCNSFNKNQRLGIHVKEEVQKSVPRRISGRPLSSVQLLSHVRVFVTPWTAARQASLSITNSCSLLKFMSTELVMFSNHLILCHPLLLLPSIFPSISVFSNESVLHIRWPKSWSFSFNISPSNECSGLISFKMDWLDLLAV